MKRINDTPHRRIFEKHHGRKIKPGYHIHHKDGNHTNNDPSNLVEVTAAEHFAIHKQQKDWAACILLARAASVTADELAEIQRQHGKACATRGTGIHSEEFNHSARSRKMWEKTQPGRKPVTDGARILKFKTEEEVLEFLEKNSNWRRGVPDYVKRGLRESTRRLTSEESKQISQKRLTEGKHNFIIEYECPWCSVKGKGPMMKRWHFDNCNKKYGVN